MTTQAGKENQNIIDKRTDWVAFFKDSSNIYVNDLAKRARRSPTHSAIIKAKTIYTVGSEFVFNGEDSKYDLLENEREFVDKANSKQSLRQVFHNIANNYILTGNAYLRVKRESVGGQESFQIKSIDSTKVRIDEKQEIAFISAFWRDIKNSDQPDGRYPIEQVELWNGDIDTTQKDFIIHIKQDELEFDYYGVPEYHGVLKWADIEYKIPTFNLDDFNNGFFPSVAMTLVGEPPEGQTPKAFLESVKAAFSGEGNNGKMWMQLVDDPSQEIRVREFQRDMKGSFEELDRLAAQRIISGHRWFASLAGIMVGGQLGSNQQIINEWNIAMKSVVIPEFQNPIIELFDIIFKIRGWDLTLGVINKPPVGMEGIDPKLVMSIDEQRKEIGIPPDERNKNETLEILRGLSPLLANKIIEKLTDEEIKELIKTENNGKPK